ncbi:MAG: AraC family transcriptional regulator [Planctomycetota bacterium]|nr:AraC family transcriptional regulator [Planctomycetota bacterium]
MVSKCIYTNVTPTIHAWRLGKPPPGAAVWAAACGNIVSDGRMHRAKLGTHHLIHAVLRGRGTLRAGKQEWPITPGCLFAHWPGLELEWWEEPSRPLRYCWVTVIGPGAGDFLTASGLSPDTMVCRPHEPERVARRIQALFNYYGQIASGAPGNPYRALSLLYGIAARAQGEYRTRQTSDGHELVTEAQLLIESLLADQISVQELATIMEVSRNTLFRAFRKELGVTPITYIKNERIRLARDLLANTDETVTTIAGMAGFGCPKYFQRCFREAAGISPGQWRIEHARG